MPNEKDELVGTRTIYRNCETEKAANRIQNKLYTQFDFVRLIRSPFFGGFGLYGWAVKGEIEKKRSKHAKHAN